MGFTVPAFSNRIGADHAELSALREEAALWLSQSLDESGDTTVADVSLVLTELAANVIDHTSSDSVDVELRVEDEWVTVVVLNSGPVDSVPPIDRWGELAEDLRGRGLRLIRALCDEIEVSGDDETTRICCRYPIS